MLEAPLTVFADLVVTLALGAFEVSLLVLIASVRPWAYLLVPSYRARTKELLSGRSTLARAWYMTWGTLAVLASVLVVAGAVRLFLEWREYETARTRTNAESVVRKALGALRPSPQASSP